MKVKILPFQLKEKAYYISPYNGNLYKLDSRLFKNDIIEEKLCIALNVIENPYSFTALHPDQNSIKTHEFNFQRLTQYHSFLLRLSNSHFYLSRIYCSQRQTMFENTIVAFDAISRINLQNKFRNDLCLQRSLLAMKTSKTFKKDGILFIGASLPSGKMHAWIIENGIQPDRLDRNWIMYRPMLALYY